MRNNMKRLLLIPLFASFVACGGTVNENAIQGASPVDITMNLENEGFENNKTHTAESISYQLKKVQMGSTLICDVFSSEPNTIESIRATIMSDAVSGKITDFSFLSYVGSIDYDSANREAAVEWIKRNKDIESDTIIGDAKFSIIAPSDYVRTLNVEKSM